MERASGGHERVENAQTTRGNGAEQRGDGGGEREGSAAYRHRGLSARVCPCTSCGSALYPLLLQELLLLFVLLLLWTFVVVVVVVVDEDEHGAEGRAFAPARTHTAGARRQRAKDPQWARRITASTHAPWARASQQRPSVHITRVAGKHSGFKLLTGGRPEETLGFYVELLRNVRDVTAPCQSTGLVRCQSRWASPSKS